MANTIELSSVIKEYLSENFGEEYLSNFELHIHSEPVSYIRIPSFTNQELLISRLEKYGIVAEPLEALPFVYKVLKGKEILGKTLEYALGHYYIQGLSSMIPPIILNPAPDEITLDLCAAPGSKSSQIADMMQNRGTLYVNEPDGNRIKGLVYNLEKMNFVNVGFLKQKGEFLSNIFPAFFDKILVDAPCTALGIMQKKGEVSNWWSSNHALNLSELQYKLLVSAIKMLRTGGTLVYSTCSVSLEENEFVLNKILEKYPVEILEIELPVKSVSAITKTREGKELNPEISRARRIVPWEADSEGFFIAKLSKTGDTDIKFSSPDKFKQTRGSYKSGHIENKPGFLQSSHKNIKMHLDELSAYYSINRELLDKLKYLIRDRDVYCLDAEFNTAGESFLYKSGSKFGSFDKNGLLRLHTLAAQYLGEEIKSNTVDLEEENLKTYFEGGTIKGFSAERGQKVVRCRNYTLGTAAATQEGLKSQFPRSLRTHEIIL